MSPSSCYHCGEPVPSNVDLVVEVFAKQQSMCCIGCQGVSQAIVDNGLSSYYKHRSEPGSQGVAIVPSELQEILAYDLNEIEQDFVFIQDNHKEVLLTVENVSCAACAWLIEGKLITLAGLVKCNVNTTTARIAVVWDHTSELKLSDILRAIALVGYKAYPFAPDKAEQQQIATAKAHLRKLIVAGLCTMQVMMFALASYFDHLDTLSDGLSLYFRWISLVIVLPVVVYCAQPFYQNAWSGLVAKRVNMDIPVSIAIALSFGASVYATVINQGEVYFESVSMFAFFLLLGRYFEQGAQKKAAMVSSNLLKLIPTTANRLSDDDAIESVPAKTLVIGDRVLVKPGQTIPADGIILSGQSHANEAILTGEQIPVRKDQGSWVYASSINIDSPITVRVGVKRGEQLIAKIIRLQEQASHDKPQLANLAERLSQYVVIGILLLASLTYIGWSLAGNPNALWVAIAVLVATCPCALSLATPSAYTCAIAAMSQHGLLLRSGKALDSLTKVTHICFDKTGTLTTGNFEISQTVSDLPHHTALALAAALESQSQHPIARAFKPFYDQAMTLSDVVATSGAGICGRINGQMYRLGNANYVQVAPCDDLDEQRVEVILADDSGNLVAKFYLADQLRASSKALIDYLATRQITTTLLTGDASNHATAIGRSLAVNHTIKGQSPAQKLQYLSTLQESGAIVAMFGDGVNDAPVLAGAHLSFAMGTGSDIAKSSAEVILLQDDLSKVRHAIELSHRVSRIIKQNLAWALGYNLLAVPFAVVGLLPPYLAALGMSLSSLIVLLNSLRLLKGAK